MVASEIEIPVSAVSPLCRLGSVAEELGEHGLAVDAYTCALIGMDEEMLEGAGKVWVALGRAYLRKGGKWALSPSFQAYQEALEVLPLEDVQDAGLWYGIAVMYEAFGSWELAAEAHTAVLRNADDHNLRSVVLFRLGTLFRLLGRHEDAHDCFDAIKDSPPSPLSRADVLFQIALIYEDSGGVHDAIKLYSHITTHLFPHHAPSLAKLALFHALHVLTSEPSGQSTPQIESHAAAAHTHLDQLLAIEPESPNAKIVLAMLAVHAVTPSHSASLNENIRAAFDHLKPVVASRPSYSLAWAALGRVYYACLQLTDALHCYETALALSFTEPPLFLSVLASMTIIYTAAGQHEDALAAYHYRKHFIAAQ